MNPLVSIKLLSKTGAVKGSSGKKYYNGAIINLVLHFNKEAFSLLNVQEISVLFKNESLYLRRCDIDTHRRIKIHSSSRMAFIDYKYHDYAGEYYLEENENEEFELIPIDSKEN